jgi:hypothetical protein
MKNPFKKKQNKGIPTEAVPRSEKEINEEYTSLCAQLGQSEYNKTILTKRIEWLTGKLLTVDKEMARRQELNKAAKEAEAAVNKAPPGQQNANQTVNDNAQMKAQLAQ